MSMYDFYSGQGILAKIPEQESEFLLAHIQRIMDLWPSLVEEPSLPVILRQFADVFSGKAYGWEEALLDGTFFRFPSEIRNQRFCSEEAFKNYLFCRLLQFPARYCILTNWERSGTTHEIVLVSHGTRMFVLDWDVYEVTVEDHCLRSLDSRQPDVWFDQLVHLVEDDVLERVRQLRKGDYFLDALTSGQILRFKHYSAGELETLARYHPEQELVELVYLFNRYFGEVHIYYAVTMQPNNEYPREELGIIIGERNRFASQRLPILTANYGMIEARFLSERGFYDNVLDPKTKRNIWLQAGFGALMQDGKHGNQKRDAQILSVKAARDNETLDPQVRRHAAILLRTYQKIYEIEPEKGGVYWDYKMYEAEMNKYLPELEPLVECISKYLDLPTPQAILFVLLSDMMNCLEDLLQLDETEGLQAKLYQLLEEKAGLLYAYPFQQLQLGAILKGQSLFAL